MRDIGIYVHIPFCKSKCYYCDFVSFANKEGMEEKYIKSLQKEIEEKSKQDRFLVKTIYIGGGTPSFIDEKYIKDILNTIRRNFEIEQSAEITIEVNPGTVNLEKLQTYYNIGINRLSVGLQSSKDNLLREVRKNTYL